MKLFFEHSYTWLFLIVALAFSAAYVFFIYRSKSQEAVFSAKQRYLLSALRFLSLSLLSFLLLSTAFQFTRTKKINPVVIVAFDNSESQKSQQENSEELINRAKQGIRNAQVELWSFGEKAKKSESPSYTEVRSDYGNLFDELSDSYLPNTIKAVLLIGDGIFNTGTDPAYKSRSLSYPVYSIGIGDSTKYMDAAILNVTHNRTTFIGNMFPVEVNLNYSELNGNSSIITIWKDSEQVYENTIQVQGNDDFHQELVHLKADQEGIVNYRVEVNIFEGEINTENNEFNFSIRVSDEKQKILLLGSGPSPDLAALKRALAPNKNYACTIVYGTNKEIAYKDYNLIVASELADPNYAKPAWIKELEESKIPVLWIAGTRFSAPSFNQLQEAIQFEQVNGFEFASSELNPEFNLFVVDDEWQDEMNAWPPVQVPFADVTLSGDWQVLANQKIQGIAMNRPLIAVGRKNGQKVGLIAGEGFWRWRIQNMVHEGNTNIFDNIILKLTNYLILTPQEDNFNVFYQFKYQEDQDVSVTAELLNESYELVTDPDVTLVIRSEDQNNYEYVFDKQEQLYSLNVGHLPVGRYNFEASATIGEKTYKELGAFQVEKVQLELSNTRANFNLLYQIAHNTSGEFATADCASQVIDKLNDSLQKKSEVAKQEVFKELISIKWLVIILILLFGMEWFLRKFWGSY